MEAKKIALSLDPDVVAILKEKAKAQHRSLAKYIEALLRKDVGNVPNAETKKALKDAHEGRNLKKMGNVDAFFDSL